MHDLNKIRMENRIEARKVQRRKVLITKKKDLWDVPTSKSHGSQEQSLNILRQFL